MDDLFPVLPRQIHVDPNAIREELLAILAAATAANSAAPWDRKNPALSPQVFPQMCNWLPRDEADDLRRKFAQELDRIKPLLSLSERLQE